MSKLLGAPVLVFLTAFPASAQSIDSIWTTFDQSRQLMHINYSLFGLNYRKEVNIIPCYVSGTSGPVPLKAISGDFGWTNRGGRNKLVLWDPFKDGVNSLDGVRIELKKEFRDAIIPRFWAVEWHGSNKAPIGLKVMQLNWLGYYAGFRVGRRALEYRNTVSEIELLGPELVRFTDKRRTVSYALSAGPLFQITRNLYTYAGIGYGAERLFWQYQTLDQNQEPLNTAWALKDDSNYEGVLADAGFFIRLGRVVIDAGVSTIQFKSLQFTAGIGYTLYKTQRSKKRPFRLIPSRNRQDQAPELQLKH